MAFAAATAVSIMSHGYKKNKVLPHDDDDFVLLRFAILLLLFLLHRYIHTMWTLLWCGTYVGKLMDDTNTIERRPINVP